MSKKVNALLVELLIVVLFFSLACIVLIKVYAGAAHISIRAGDRNSALLEAQNLAEQIYCADAGKVADLLENDILKNDELDCFTACGDHVWEKTAADTENILFRYTMISEPEAGKGGLREGKLEAFALNEEGNPPVFSLDCVRYLPGKAVGQ